MLKHDTFRCKKYAVLTADDGWASLKNILPWLNEQYIPITLFLNPAYLDGKHFREKETEKYLTVDDLDNLHKLYPLLTIASHGWEHIDATKQTTSEFMDSVNKSDTFLKPLQNFIPYFAFTYGRYTMEQLDILKNKNLTPLLVKGNKNYKDDVYIDREILGIDYLRPYM